MRGTSLADAVCEYVQGDLRDYEERWTRRSEVTIELELADGTKRGVRIDDVCQN